MKRKPAARLGSPVHYASRADAATAPSLISGKRMSATPHSTYSPRAVRRFVAYQLVSQTNFISAIWIIFLQSRGLSLAEVGLAESAFHISKVLLEVPSGVFADAVGRRWSLAIGSLLVAVEGVLLLFVNSLPLAVLALALSGASYSFRLGADQAYLYEAVGEGQGSYARIFGRMLSLVYLAGAAGSWLGATLSEWSYAIPIGLSAASGAVGVWLAIRLPEPPRRPQVAAKPPSVRSRLADAARVLRGAPVLMLVLLTSAVFWVADAIGTLYIQASFSDRGLSNSQVGLIISLTLLVNAGGTAVASRLERRGKFTVQFAVLALLAGAGLAATGLPGVIVAVAAFLGSQVMTGLIEPLLYAWLNEGLPSEHRATLLSIDSWLYSVLMIVAFPAAGWLAERYSWALLYGAAGGVAAAAALAMLPLGGKRFARAEAAA